MKRIYYIITLVFIEIETEALKVFFVQLIRSMNILYDNKAVGSNEEQYMKKTVNMDLDKRYYEVVRTGK